MTSKHQQKRSTINHFLNSVGKIGGKLSNPSILFFLMCVDLVIMAWVISLFNVSVKHPSMHQTTYVKDITSRDRLTMIMNDTTENFSEFPALGLVLAMMIGIGAAEKTGYFDKLVISVVDHTPRFLILPTIMLVGILGSTAGDAATIILLPLVAMFFIKIGYHPIAGLTVAYASAVGGLTVNIVVDIQDASVYSFTEPATRIVSDFIKTNVAMNWYFITASVVVLLPTILPVTTRLIVPRLGKYDDNLMHDDHEETSSHTVDKEAHALKQTNISFIITIILLIIITIPEHSFLRNARAGSLLGDAPLINGVRLIILVVFLIPGLVYGILSKEIKNTRNLGKVFGDTVGSIGTFIVIVFFAAQLLAYLKWSNLGIIAAVKDAKLLEHQNGIVLMLGIIVLSAMVNVLVGSASAKQGILEPIFIPILILIGFHPAFTQAIYRIGNSITNPIIPIMPYLPLLLVCTQKYDKRMELGALLSSLMPYSIALSIVWTVLVTIWFLLGIPVGPGGLIFTK